MNPDQTVPREPSDFGSYCLQEDERRVATNVLTGGMRVHFQLRFKERF